MIVSEKAVRFEIGIWLDERGAIHLAATDPEVKRLVKHFHTTVENRDGSKRCHKNLYAKLESVLNAVFQPTDTR